MIRVIYPHENLEMRKYADRWCCRFVANGRIFLLGERCIEPRSKNWRPLVGWNRRASRTFG
uniref:Uncharacterized protein n=1 Tax=Candidatus Kentrum sp. FM TaxID=2126340 RepID=A0A450TN80_9GAMM|nr:MAG: hypothetical protein BECKFM1743C_GA0114222_102861 [Candidatus Kentron sp. FM]VFJ69216.1 MAG: hypothetical protein BECKFM1743A_GA0114220_105021 [Candidatus Kentron sp. FM]VFK12868.1 MAG: hypothetical protein BECKFM1743B_GA0114221_102594 [Candidatus Kentron sp. FM]